MLGENGQILEVDFAVRTACRRQVRLRVPTGGRRRCEPGVCKNRKIERVHDTVTALGRDVADERCPNELVCQGRRLLAEQPPPP